MTNGSGFGTISPKSTFQIIAVAASNFLGFVQLDCITMLSHNFEIGFCSLRVGRFPIMTIDHGRHICPPIFAHTRYESRPSSTARCSDSPDSSSLARGAAGWITIDARSTASASTPDTRLCGSRRSFPGPAAAPRVGDTRMSDVCESTGETAQSMTGRWHPGVPRANAHDANQSAYPAARVTCVAPRHPVT